MSELTHVLHAVRFLTIVPVPDAEHLAPDWLPRSAKYFPLVGLLVGLLSAAVLALASQLWTGVVPALLAVTASVLVTGAFHEDGLADSADSLGGRTPEARLAIMRDSRIGSYGTLALGLSVALRTAALSIAPLPIAVASLIAAHAGGRLAGVLTMARLPYAADPAAVKILHSAEPFRRNEQAIGCAFALIAFVPLCLMAWPAALCGAAVGAGLALATAWLAARLIRGYTGDVLGAIEQLVDVAVLLAAAAAASR
jgi:adenosylcobinamide-GDP ribazoletransferase